MSVGGWLLAIGLGVFSFTVAIIGLAITLEYFHSKSLNKQRRSLENDYERELIWQKAREEELAEERRQSVLDETNREYMDAMRAEEIMEELEKGNIK